MKYDVVIAGGRVAGAATALLVARAGGRVLVLDKGGYGTDTLSTHASMRGAVMQLHRWGLLPAITFAATPPIRSTTFSYEGLQITIPIEPRFGVSALYAPRRALLDRVIANAAANAGAEFEYRCDVQDVMFDSRGRASGVVVLKDGAGSSALRPISSSAPTAAIRRLRNGSARRRCGRRATQPVCSTPTGTGLAATPTTGAFGRTRQLVSSPPTTKRRASSSRCRGRAFATS